MRKEFFPPLMVLAVILAFTIWTGNSMKADTHRWQEQLHQADLLAQQGNWPAAIQVLSDSYQDWTSRQNRLHIISRHDVVDDAEAMYNRAMAFSVTREPSEFQAELADLQIQLQLLSEMERFHLKNIL